MVICKFTIKMYIAVIISVLGKYMYLILSAFNPQTTARASKVNIGIPEPMFHLNLHNL